MNEFGLNVRMEAVTCAACGAVFGLPEGFVQGKRKSEESFFCPNGHTLSFLSPETKRLLEEHDRKAAEERMAKAETRRLKAVERKVKQQRRLAEKLAVRQDSLPPRERWLGAANGTPPEPASPVPPGESATP